MPEEFRYRLPAPARRPEPGLWPSLRLLLSSSERAKRQLEKAYQRRARRRLRESGLAARA